MKRILFVWLLVLALFAAWTFSTIEPTQARPEPSKGPAIRLHRKAETDLAATFAVTGLEAADLERLSRARLDEEQWQALFAVFVAGSTPEADRKQPAMLGSYRIDMGILRFEPRYPLTAGARYRAVFQPSRLPGRAGPAAEAVVAAFEIPARKEQPTTVVEQVYPSASKLPENQLRFYLHFSAPMSRGEAYQHVRLLDSAGKTVEAAFLELGEELWNNEGTRFTLLVDPGRIKRGLKPREELGPVLEANKAYTLVVDRGWKDARGNPLKADHRKAFRTVPEYDKAIDVKEWKLVAPPANGSAALQVSFPRPLDRALLNRLLWVTDGRGRKVAGTIKVTDEETRWSFTPARPWVAGDYQLVADTTLEDTAGNTIKGPFEVDVFRPIERKIETVTVQLPFSCK